MKPILSLLLIFGCSTALADDPVATLRAELAGLNISSPEADATRDFANGQTVCFSVNGYTLYFPGVPEQHRRYCAAREKNFRGTRDVIMTREHGELIAQAEKYAKRYNTHVLRHRK